MKDSKTPEEIEKEIYKYINKKTGKKYSNELFIQNIANDYCLFQESFLNLVNNKISVSYEKGNEAIFFNNLIGYATYLNASDDIRISIHTGYNGYSNKSSNKFISWFGVRQADPDSLIYLTPSYKYDVGIDQNKEYQKIDYDKDVKASIQLYLYEQISYLSNKNQKKMNKTINFLNEFFALSLMLKEKEIHIEDFIPSNTYLSTEELSNLLKNSKDFLLLTNDIDISPQLEIIKKNNFKEKSIWNLFK